MAVATFTPTPSLEHYAQQIQNQNGFPRKHRYLEVIRNRTGNEHLYLTRLLRDTQPSCRWQEPLRDLLSVYIMETEAKHAASFLLHNIETATHAMQDPDHSPCYPSLYIDVKRKPPILNVDHWKKILIGLHFDLTEVEGRHDIDLIDVKVSHYVTLALLSGFRLLLQSIIELDWGMLRMAFSLTSQEALGLLSVIQNVLMPKAQPIQDTQLLVSLHNRYPDQLSGLGFRLVKNKRVKEATWTRPDSDTIFHLEVVLLGLFHDGTGLESFI